LGGGAKEGETRGLCQVWGEWGNWIGKGGRGGKKSKPICYIRFELLNMGKAVGGVAISLWWGKDEMATPSFRRKKREGKRGGKLPV